MSNDRELLELAAKAAGIELGAWFFYNTLPEQEWQFMLADRSAIWNPLRIDGDALRLAVDLDIFNHEMFSSFLHVAKAESRDPRAAYRMAIVDIAAEIGRSIP